MPHRDTVEDLQKENRRLAIISQIARSIVVNMSYGEIIDQFSTALRAAIPFDLLSFCLLEGGNLVIKSGIPKEQGILGIGTVMGEEYYIPWRAVKDRRACLRRDIWNDAHHGAEDALLRQLGIRSAVVAPLLVEDRAIGTLNLGNRDAYSEMDAVYVQQLADQLAVCLQNS
ncbi:MAG TPA: GAF domain-containing protein, partial [Deferrisomatales bacterium]|nr:GAF domain-containing protein [Deferrisomatales bacterium]